ncbi:MAG TPA: SDR family NAD(P)-dependent oxidoreductase [Acetobacteraceae bacterium]|nr:SDR family NAD(P)-dependent oxidoreductase [Acetobacteraceae bacterium]
MMSPTLLILGLGYSGAAVARAAVRAGFTVIGTRRDPGSDLGRDPGGAAGQSGITVIPFDSAAPALREATHLLATAGPGPDGDPVLASYGAAIAAAPCLGWLGYLSTTGIYGDRQGGWVDEDTPPDPTSERARARIAAEEGWRAVARGRSLDIFRLAGIYGPGRSALDDVRAGRARRIIKPGHAFGRIHRDDIAAAVLAAMRQAERPPVRVLNLADDEPAESAEVVAEAARLLGAPVPPAIPFAEAEPSMSPMARGFWAENRKVASARTQAMLGLRWRYPTYREGLRGILAEQLGDRPA